MAEIHLVTGGAGFIGSHIAARLLRDGHTVRVIDNLLTGSEANLDYLKGLNGDLAIHRLSVTDLPAIRQVFMDVDYVYHLAAIPSVFRSIDNPLESHEHTATGTLNVLLAARDSGVRRVVYAGSSAVYGDLPGDQQIETMAPRPISPYGAAKLAGEYYCQSFTAVYGLETVCLRYFNVFGPRQDPTSHYAAVIPKFITAILSGQPPNIYGDGGQTRDFTYVENVVHGNLLAARAPDAAGQSMNLATGSVISLVQLVDKINAILGTDIQPIHTEARAGDIRHSQASIDRARHLLDYAPVVDFDTGLAQTIAHYQQQR